MRELTGGEREETVLGMYCIKKKNNEKGKI